MTFWDWETLGRKPQATLVVSGVHTGVRECRKTLSGSRRGVPGSNSVHFGTSAAESKVPGACSAGAQRQAGHGGGCVRRSKEANAVTMAYIHCWANQRHKRLVRTGVEILREEMLPNTRGQGQRQGQGQGGHSHERTEGWSHGRKTCWRGKWVANVKDTRGKVTFATYSQVTKGRRVCWGFSYFSKELTSAGGVFKDGNFQTHKSKQKGTTYLHRASNVINWWSILFYLHRATHTRTRTLAQSVSIQDDFEADINAFHPSKLQRAPLVEKASVMTYHSHYLPWNNKNKFQCEQPAGQGSTVSWF